MTANSTRINDTVENIVPEIQLLSAERFAAMLDISVRTLWRLRSAGKVPPPIRIGGNIRWNAAVIHEWINDGCPAIPPQRARPQSASIDARRIKSR